VQPDGFGFFNDVTLLLLALWGTLEGGNMLRSMPIVAFVATTMPARAKEFYANVLELSLLSEDGFALMFDAGGTKLRVAIVREHRPAGYTVLGWIVPEIRRSIQVLASRGVKFNRYEGFGQDEFGTWTSPSGARVAWFSDPDGNTLSLTEFESEESS
jgi:predicted enzyme related to lactoylglutathione lyase